MGLLLSHNCTLKVWNDLVVFSRDGSEPPPGGGKRKEIFEFTRESRKRMIEELHKVKFESTLFVTLTYPDEFPRDWERYKKHLRAFRSRVERRFGKVRAFWRLEYQKRGAPHYHLLYFDPPFIPKEWVSRAWYEIVKSGDERHLHAGTNVQYITGQEDIPLVAFYVGKYVAKEAERVEDNERGNTGRHWGKWNIETEDPFIVHLESGEAERIAIECFSRRGRADTWRPSDYLNSTCMGDSMGTTHFRQLVISLTVQGARGGR